MKDTSQIKSALLDCIGPFPTRVPLEATLVSSEDCGTYWREKVEYGTEPGEKIPAFLLRPKRPSEKRAAIFCHHQHAGEFALGKSEVVGLAGNPDQAYAAELAERGHIVLAPDAIAFEERNWANGTSWAEYHELATRLVRGYTLLAKALHDISVGLDYLQSLPEVDCARLGFLGHSYGGRMAIWAPAFDSRIKASVSHCGCVNYKNSLGGEVGIQMEFCVPGIMNVADIEDVIPLIEPGALLISATSDDKWSRGAEEIYNYAKAGFKTGTLELKLYEAQHVFTAEMRTFSYEFLERYL